MSVPLTPSADKNWITACWACLEESMARSLTVISLLLQSTTYCCYRVYTKFLLTYTAIYRGNCKVLPLGITALQPQSHFQLGTPYTMGTRSFPGVKRPDHPPPPSSEVKERVALYLYSPFGPSWPVLGWTLLLPLSEKMAVYIQYLLHDSWL